MEPISCRRAKTLPGKTESPPASRKRGRWIWIWIGTVWPRACLTAMKMLSTRAHRIFLPPPFGSPHRYFFVKLQGRAGTEFKCIAIEATMCMKTNGNKTQCPIKNGHFCTNDTDFYTNDRHFAKTVSPFVTSWVLKTDFTSSYAETSAAGSSPPAESAPASGCRPKPRS